MLVMPADHVIQNNNAFQLAVEQGAGFAEQNQLVTFGVVPTGPETGYGYIQKGAPLMRRQPVTAMQPPAVFPRLLKSRTS